MKKVEQRARWEHSTQKPRKIAIFSLGVTTLTIFGVFFLWQFLQRPAAGTLYPRKAVQREGLDAQGEALYQGSLFSFSYRAQYTKQSGNKPEQGPIQESIVLSDPSIEAKQIVIIIANRHSKDLAADPSFQVRMDKPDVYTRKHPGILGERVVMFEKNSSVFEETAFFYHTPYIVSVSLTSLFNIDGLEDELFQLLKTMRFE